MSRKGASLLKIIYFICIVSAAIYCFKRPLYNWDILPYSYLILKLDHYNTTSAHALTYKQAKEDIPPQEYYLLVDSSKAFRYKMSRDPEAFNQQLPFYVVKPLYTALTFLSYKSGASLLKATLIPSLIAYLLIGFLLFQWLGIYLRPLITFIVSLLIMISSPLIEVAKMATPDCLSAFLLLSAFYFILRKQSLLFAVLFLILSIFTRLDNIITCVAVLATMYASRKWHQKITLTGFLFIIILFACCYSLVGLITYQYAWSIFFYSDFANHLRPSHDSENYFSMQSYLRLVYEHVLSAINHSYLAIFLALLFFNFTEKVKVKDLSFNKIFLLLILFILLARFILYPDISDRFYIPFYLVIIILTAQRISSIQVAKARPQG